MKTNVTKRKKIFALIAILLAFAAIAVYLLGPAIVIDLSYDGKARLNADSRYDSVKALLSDYKVILPTIAVLLGQGTYDVVVCQQDALGSTIDTSVFMQQDKMAFNPVMMAAIVIVVLSALSYIYLLVSKKKSGTISKLILAGFIIGALMILLTAVWFYAFNPIEGSNDFDELLKSGYSTKYMYVNAHLCWAPLVSSGLLVGAAVFQAIGE